MKTGELTQVFPAFRRVFALAVAGDSSRSDAMPAAIAAFKKTSWSRHASAAASFSAGL